MSAADAWDRVMSVVSDHLDAGEGRQAWEMAAQAAAEAEAQGQPAAAVRLQVLAAYGARACGERAAADQALCAGEALAEPLQGDERADLELSLATARARLRWAAGDAVSALAHLEQAWRAHSPGAAEATRLSARNIFGALHGTLGQTEDAEQWFNEVLRGAEAAGDGHGAVLALGNLSACAVERADLVRRQRGAAAAVPAYAAAEVRLLAAMPSVMRSGNALMGFVLHVNLAHALRSLGRLDEADAALETAARGLPSQPVHLDNLWTLWQLQLAMLRAAQGRDAEALAALEPLLQRAADTGEDPIGADVQALAAELAERRGDTAAALAHYKRHHAAEKARATAEAETRARLAEMRERLRQLETESERLRAEARRDALTGLANRRALDEAIARHQAGAPAGAAAPAASTEPAPAEPLCVAMIDIDHFKLVNDRHSHAVGDSVLQQLAQVLQAQAGPGDLAVRQGGEEFVWLMPGLALPQAQARCEQLRQAVQVHPWAEVAPNLSVTVSVGVALGRPGALPRALAAADQALYAAKREGRNRVTVADGRAD